MTGPAGRVPGEQRRGSASSLVDAAVDAIAQVWRSRAEDALSATVPGDPTPVAVVRVMVGIAGPPGAGKSTLAAALLDAVPRRLGLPAAVVPMDGFHLANAELARLGLADRKGAPETFDVAGFVNLLRRLRKHPPAEVVYAPTFDRGVNESIGSAIPVGPDLPVVLVEGNYLLADGPWASVRGLLDVTLYVDAPARSRRRALVHRHINRGLDPDSARDWVLRSDEANARLIAATRSRADHVLTRPGSSRRRR